MVPIKYPPQQKKTDSVKTVLGAAMQRKADEEQTARQIAGTADSDGLYRLMTAVEKSERLVAEDLAREAGYMLPQSGNTHELLKKLLADPPEGFPAEAAEKLLKMIPDNDQ